MQLNQPTNDSFHRHLGNYRSRLLTSRTNLLDREGDGATQGQWERPRMKLRRTTVLEKTRHGDDEGGNNNNMATGCLINSCSVLKQIMAGFFIKKKKSDYRVVFLTTPFSNLICITRSVKDGKMQNNWREHEEEIGRWWGRDGETKTKRKKCRKCREEGGRESGKWRWQGGRLSRFKAISSVKAPPVGPHCTWIISRSETQMHQSIVMVMMGLKLCCLNLTNMHWPAMTIGIYVASHRGANIYRSIDFMQFCTQCMEAIEEKHCSCKKQHNPSCLSCWFWPTGSWSSYLKVYRVTAGRSLMMFCALRRHDFSPRCVWLLGTGYQWCVRGILQDPWHWTCCYTRLWRK